MPRSPLAAARTLTLAALGAGLAATLTLACARAGATPATAAASTAQPPRVLVFAKTAAFRHGSIPSGKVALLKLGAENGFAVDTTEDAARFTAEGLAPYRAVVFLNTTGDVLTDAQQAAFERWVRAGGGWVGIHAATDTEYGWPWYNRLAGAYFQSHPGNPNVRRGTFTVVDKAHPATEGMPERFERMDEFYHFKQMQPGLRVLVRIDETSYPGGSGEHPMSWAQEFEGGRAFYTAMGHTNETFSEPLFLRHLLGGLRWAMRLAR
jgi:cytochrome c